VADLYEVLLVDGDRRWSAGWVVDDDTDTLLAVGGKVLVWSGRPGLEHYAQEHGLTMLDDLPDEVDLDLDGWLTGGGEPPPTAEVSELWHLLLDAPHVGTPLQGDEIEEAYDDLVEEVPDWYAQHGDLARAALKESVARLRKALSPQG
jgi:hypothetical protein